ncbi:MAG: hypothetical protein U1F12_03130 [Pseudomonadales bacterium]
MLKQAFFAGFFALCVAASAQAVTLPYHVNDGYYGSVTIRARGSCGFAPITYKNVWFGEVFDSGNASQGYGLITANGQPLFWEEDYAPLRHRNNDDIGTGKDVSYTNMVGAELVALAESLSGCSLWTIVPNTNSRATIQWDAYRQYDRMQLRANFSGFDKAVCLGPVTNMRCSAKGFSGSIAFRGNRGTP